MAGKFGTTKPAGGDKSAGKKPAPAPKQKKKKYKDLTPEEPKAPIIPLGKGVAEIISHEYSTNEGNGNETVTVNLRLAEVTEGDGEEGQECVVLFTRSSKSESYVARRFFAYVIAAAGFESVQAYNEVDPDNDFFAQMFDQESTAFDDQTLDGRFVAYVATQGKPVLKDGEPTGEHYTDLKWSPIDEEHQSTSKLRAPTE